MLDVRRVADRVAEIVDAVDQRVLGNLEALLAGPQQEIGDKRRQPETGIIAIGRPQAKGARARLAIDQSFHGLLHALIQFTIDILRADTEIAQIQQRQGAAYRLFGAAIGVAVEIADKPRDIEFRQRTDRERHRRGAR